MMKRPGWFGDFWTTYHRVAAWIAILLLSSLTFLSAGLFASSVSKTTGVATAVAYSITAAICLASFAPVVLGTKLSSGFAAAVLSVNPVAAAMQAINSSAFPEYPGLWKTNLWVMGALTLFFLGGATVRVWRLFNKMD
jgi:ABC-type transport system involved in multi-copper enzyme maturation permease subunit